MLEATAGEPAITIDEKGKIRQRADASVHEIVDGLQTLFHMIVRSVFIGREQVSLKPNLVPGPDAEMRVFFQQ